MRAEAQKYADAVRQSLALLRRILFRTPRRRLADLNRRAEDPEFLEQSAESRSSIMREQPASCRTRACGYPRSEGGVDDAIVLIELGKSEKDKACRTKRARCAQAVVRSRGAASEVVTLLSGEADSNDTYLEMHAGRAARRARTGPACCCACTAGRSGDGYKVDLARAERGRGSRHQVGHAADRRRERLRLAQDRVRRAPTGPHLALRQQRAQAHQLCQRLGISSRRRQHRDRHQGKRLPHRHLPRVRGGRPARQHDRLCGTHHAHPDQHRGGPPAGAVADQEPGDRLGDAEVTAVRTRAEEARGEGGRGRRSKTDIGWGHQIRSYVLQPYQLVKDLRTGAQSTDPQKVLDGDIDQFIEAALAQRMSDADPAKVEDID